jgi:DNA-binding NtrC family response regulator
VDIRVVCSTKVDLWQHVTEGRFREDLFFRLNIVPIKLPPLRETRADIPLLVEHFLTLHEAGDAARRRVPELLDQLMAHDWPGNIRELENVVQRIIALPEVADLDLAPARARPAGAAEPETPDRAGDYPPYLQYIERKDREIIEWALNEAGSNISQAAELLRIPRSTLRSKMLKYGIAGI